MVRLRLENVVKDYGNGMGVEGVSLEIEDGEFFVILGPSGSGKTTTLRMIAGLETVDSGRIFVDNTEITDFPPNWKNMAMVFQNYALYPFLSVRQNLEFPLKKRKVKKEEIDIKIEKISKTLGITEILDSKPGQISGGQRQRVALGRALIREPLLFLMDEPLSNLDAKLRTSMRAELKRLQKEFAITTVYVTHDQIEAMTLADRVAVMNKGRIVQLGKPDDIYNNPNSYFVATFVGDPQMNILKGRLEKQGKKFSLTFSGCSISIDGSDIQADSNSLDVRVGFRPEAITRVDSNGISARISVIQDLGNRRLEHYSVSEDGSEVIRYTADDNTSSIGAPVQIFPGEGYIYLFREDSDKLIGRIDGRSLRDFRS